MKKQRKREKVNLWYSETKAQEGKYFFFPCAGGKEVIKCTGITLDNQPPSDSSKFLSDFYLPLIRQEVKESN